MFNRWPSRVPRQAGRAMPALGSGRWQVMGQWLSEHYNWVLGLVTVLIWATVVVWFLQSTGYLGEWVARWRARRKSSSSQ